MTQGPDTLTPMRRRAVDRLLIQYLELGECEQAAWLARTRQRLPRLVDAGLDDRAVPLPRPDSTLFVGLFSHLQSDPGTGPVQLPQR